jgi:hypothetical protein
MKFRINTCVLACAAGLLTAAFSGLSQTKPAVQVKIPIIVARPEDVSSIESIVKADYESISGGVGVPRQWGRDLSLYGPHGWFVGIGTNSKTDATIKRSFTA